MKLNFDTLTSWYDQPLHTLKEINAKKKDLVGVEDISSCSALRKLILAENNLSNNNASFTGLDSLTFLDLSHNEFTSLDGWENLTHLNVLNVSKNTIATLPEDMSHFQSLKALILNNNELSKVPGLNVLINLNTLVISHNSITKIPNLTNIPGLVKLSASHNKLKEIPNFTGQAASLKEIRLNDNKIATIPDTLRQCQSLAIIDLGNNKISKWRDIASLGSLLNLHNLNLRGNPIADNKDYKDKILALIPSLRVLDGERFDMKFLERKQKQSTNLKLMEKKDRLKREKLEKQLETDYGLEAPSRKPRHKHILREEEGPASATTKKQPTKKVESNKADDKTSDKKKGDKRKSEELKDEPIPKPTKKKKHDTFFDPFGGDATPSTTMATESPAKETAAVESSKRTSDTSKATLATPESAPVPSSPPPPPSNKRKAEEQLSHRERSGVLSMVDKSKKIKKKPAGDDVLATLEHLNKEKEERVSSGLGADAWD